MDGTEHPKHPGRPCPQGHGHEGPLMPCEKPAESISHPRGCNKSLKNNKVHRAVHPPKCMTNRRTLQSLLARIKPERNGVVRGTPGIMMKTEDNPWLKKVGKISAKYIGERENRKGNPYEEEDRQLAGTPPNGGVGRWATSYYLRGCVNYVARIAQLCNVMFGLSLTCLLYTSPSPRDRQKSRMPSSA